MTLATTNNKAIHNTNGVTVDFAYDYLVLDQSHLLVYLLLGGVLVLQSSGYSVSGIGNPSGGLVTFTVAPAGPVTGGVVLLRKVPLTQLTDYISSDAFPEDSHERALDQLTMACQQLQEEVDRSVKVGLGSAADPDALIEDIQVAVASAEASAIAADASADAAASSALAAEASADEAAASAASMVGAAYLAAVQTFTAAQRGTLTTDNDLSFNLSATNYFTCTPSAGGTLTFTGIPADAQPVAIKLVNGSNYAIAAHANTKISTTDLTRISATGTYLLTGLSDGTNVYLTASANLA